MTEATLFYATVIAALTEAVRLTVPKVTGAVTIAVAALVGLAISVFDTAIGVQDLTIAQGILTGLSAAGAVAVAKKV